MPRLRFVCVYMMFLCVCERRCICVCAQDPASDCVRVYGRARVWSCECVCLCECGYVDLGFSWLHDFFMLFLWRCTCKISVVYSLYMYVCVCMEVRVQDPVSVSGIPSGSPRAVSQPLLRSPARPAHSQAFQDTRFSTSGVSLCVFCMSVPKVDIVES